MVTEREREGERESNMADDGRSPHPFVHAQWTGGSVHVPGVPPGVSGQPRALTSAR